MAAACSPVVCEDKRRNSFRYRGLVPEFACPPYDRWEGYFILYCSVPLSREGYSDFFTLRVSEVGTFVVSSSTLSVVVATGGATIGGSTGAGVAG